jgi:hypothetical protein
MRCGLAIIMVLGLLAGCAHDTVLPGIPEPSHTVNFDHALLGECKQLEKLTGPTDLEIKDNYESVLKAYSECRTLKSKENAEIKKALNIHDE